MGKSDELLMAEIRAELAVAIGKLVHRAQQAVTTMRIASGAVQAAAPGVPGSREMVRLAVELLHEARDLEKASTELVAKMLERRDQVEARERASS